MSQAKVLMIAFHYPPMLGSSGLQRTLKFSRYIQDFGWRPTVLTVHGRAYPATTESQLADVPSGVVVKRTFCVDAARHLSVMGRYPRLLAVPDRWASWIPSAIASGFRLIQVEKLDAIWSTFPIASAHVIGAVLAKLTSLPWIADFRDSMTEEGYPQDPLIWRANRAIERLAVRGASKIVFTAPSAMKMYQSRYPDQPVHKYACIANGYDERDFVTTETTKAPSKKLGQLTLVHSGLLQPADRDPEYLFQAIAILKKSGELRENNLRVVLRATGFDPRYRARLNKLGISDFVELGEPIEYREALAEMLRSDGLLLLQGSSCNHQIPAKLYEYLRAGRPILALTDPVGDSADALRQFLDAPIIVPLTDAELIADAIRRFLSGQIRKHLVDPESLLACSRHTQAGQLAKLLDYVTSCR